jgi:hypothetical protein
VEFRNAKARNRPVRMRGGLSAWRSLPSVTQLWTPGVAGPHEEFVGRLHRQVERFAERHEIREAIVTLELHSGARVDVKSISPDPGFGFVTICPHGDDDAPDELVLPIGSIARIELRVAQEEEPRLGFSLPDAT